MTSNKEINVPISSLSAEKIYALPDDIGSDHEGDLDDLINNFETEFGDKTSNENVEIDISEALIHEKDDSNVSNLIQSRKPIEGLVRTAKPDSESVDDVDDVPSRKLVAKKCFEME